MLDININNIYMYTTYKKADFTSETIPTSKRVRTGTKNIPYIEEFQGNKFAIKLGQYISFKHIPILMTDDKSEQMLVGFYNIADQ